MRRSPLTGALIGGIFGAIWLIANANTPLGPTAATVFRVVGIAGLVVLVVGRRLAPRRSTDAPQGVDLFGRAYWQIVAAEVVLLTIGLASFAAAGAPPEVYRPWTAVVVAAHFIAFRKAGVWRGSAFWPTVPLLAVGAAGLVLAYTPAARWVVLVTGIATGLILLGGCLFVVSRELLGVKRTSEPTADRLPA